MDLRPIYVEKQTVLSGWSDRRVCFVAERSGKNDNYIFWPKLLNESQSPLLKEAKLAEIMFRLDIKGIQKRECIQQRGVDFAMTDDFAWVIWYMVLELKELTLSKNVKNK